MKPTLNPGDIHLIVNGKLNVMQAFNSDGTPSNIFPTVKPGGGLVHTASAFPHGAYGPDQSVKGGDTIAQLYTLGVAIPTGEQEPFEVRRSYGWWFIPMNDYEGKMAKFGRAGFGMHGGGKVSDFWDPWQELTYTMGCVRLHNAVVKALASAVDRVVGRGNTVWLTVTQE